MVALKIVPEIVNFAIYEILMDTCGAPERHCEEFIRMWPCGEFRFQGDLGFGGKIKSRSGIYTQDGWLWSDHIFVSCYPEDMTNARREMIKAANELLEQMRDAP